MTPSLLSLCCGALPAHGVVRAVCYADVARQVGHCSLCGEFSLFTVDGVLEREWVPVPLRSRQVAEPVEHQLDRQERHVFLRWVVGALVCGALLLLTIWLCWRVWGPSRDGQRGHGAQQRFRKEQVSGAHARQGSRSGERGQL